MSHYLYIDNFRGFIDQVIPLDQVNFFVGENSTGKTSILKLLCLFENTFFYYDYNLNLKTNIVDINFGSFKDISMSSNSFTVGYQKDFIKTKKAGIIIKYINIDGKPKVDKICYYNNNGDILSVEISFKDKKLKYKHMQVKLGSFRKMVDYCKKHFFEAESELESCNFISDQLPLSLILDLSLKKDMKEKNNEASIDQPFFQFNLIFESSLIVDPIRNEPEEIYYDFSNSTERFNDATFILRNLSKNEKYSKIFKKINEFGNKSGLFEELSVNTLEDSFFQIKVKLGKNSNSYNITKVGYGISQIYPILIHVLLNNIVSIQQPEIHLHPKAQAAFGQFIYQLSKENQKKVFYIETHSDFIIDRFRIMKRKNKGEIRSNVLFFERKGDNNCIHVVKILDNGRYVQKQPASFREFFVNESLTLLGIED